MTWPTITFSELVCTSQNGFGSRRGDGTQTVVLRLADVDSDTWTVSSTGLRKIGMSKKDRSKYGLNHGDLLVVRVNGSPAITGRVVPYTGPKGFAFCDHFIRFQLVDRADSKFIAYQFRHRPVRSQVERGMVSTAGQHTVSQRMFAGVTVELPPLAEQHRIVAAIETHFSRLDAAVASLTRAKANVKRARASVLKAAVEGRLVPTEAELARAEGRDYEPASELLARILVERKAAHEAAQEGAKRRKKYKEPVAPETDCLPELPVGWCWATVDQLGAEPLCNGRSVPSQDNGFPVLRLTAMENGRINFREAKNGSWTRNDAAKWLIENGDFFIMRGNGSINRVGSAAIAGDPPTEVAFPDTMIRLRPMKALVDPRYLLAAWSSHFLREQIEASARTTAGIHKVNQSSIAQYVIPLPPLPEQHRIVTEVDRRLSVLDALDTTIEANLARCARLRQSILKLAFEGRLVPAEAPASDTPPSTESPTSNLAEEVCS